MLAELCQYRALEGGKKAKGAEEVEQSGVRGQPCGKGGPGRVETAPDCLDLCLPFALQTVPHQAAWAYPRVRRQMSSCPAVSSSCLLPWLGFRAGRPACLLRFTLGLRSLFYARFESDDSMMVFLWLQMWAIFLFH